MKKDWRYYKAQKDCADALAFNWIEGKMIDLGSWLLKNFPWLGVLT